MVASEKFFAVFFVFFFLNNSKREICYFLLKKANEDPMGNPKRRQSTVSYTLE